MKNKIYNDKMERLIVGMAISLYVVGFTIFMMIFYKKWRLLRETNQNLNRRMKLMQFHKQRDNRKMDQIRAIKHDMLSHLQMVYNYAENKDWERVQSYLRSLSSELESIRLADWCESDTCNCIISYYSILAKQSGIEFRCAAVIPPEAPEISSDLSTILFNVLQNAVEACQELPENKRFINLSAQFHGGSLAIQIQNPYATSIKKDKKRFRSTKAGANRGYGLRNAQAASQRLDGFFEVIHEESLFTVKVLLNLY